MTEPLARGEHVDLDCGTAMTRGGSVGTSYDENWYKVRAMSPGLQKDRNTVMLEDEEIRQLAELAGYEVRDP